MCDYCVGNGNCPRCGKELSRDEIDCTDLSKPCPHCKCEFDDGEVKEYLPEDPECICPEEENDYE